MASSSGALLLAAALPILFLHVKYQPGFVVSLGSTTVNAYLSDVAVLVVVLGALAAGIRRSFAPLAPARVLWASMLAFVVWMFAAVVYGHAHAAAYAWHTHAVTAVKFAEYMLLAPAVALLVRSVRDLAVVLWSLVLTSCAATAVGVAQFFGAQIFLAGTVGHRQASFLSSSDFAALSAAALVIGVVAVAVPDAGIGRRLGWTACATGVVGMVVAASMASVIGAVTALAVLAAVQLLRRALRPAQAALAGGLVALVVVGAVAIRGSDLDNFARFLGANPSAHQARAAKIQTYAHRTLLSWLGYRIWLDHPAVGVGWEGSAEPVNFEPYLPAAHRRFPTEAADAFPSAAPGRRYGVQDAWLQALADLGVVGLVLWAAPFAAAAWGAARSGLRTGAGPALLSLLWVAVLVWLWTAQGFIAGIPLDAVTWLALGVAALGSLPRDSAA